MRRIIFLLFILVSPTLYAEDDATCHIHKSQAIHFRNYKVKDVLELSVGPGPCSTAIMTLNIRSDEGEVFYTYASRFATHVTPDPYDPNFRKFIEPFLKNLETDAQKNAKYLPEYYPQDAKLGLIKLHIGKNAYKNLRLRHLPVFFQPNSSEGWQYVIYDKKTRKGKLIVSGKYH